MIVKGIVSAIDLNANKATVILPEYNDIVTKPISAYGGTVDTLNVNDFVLVVAFNNDLNDCMILLCGGGNAANDDSNTSLLLADANGVLLKSADGYYLAVKS